MIQLKNLLILKTLQFFLENPYQEIYLREFARKLKISPNTAQRFLTLLLKENIIVEERRANLRYFKSNLDDVVFRQIKKTYSIKKIQDSGLLEELKNNVTSLVVFGSVAKGLDDKNSDIDLLIITINKKKVEKIIFNFQEKVDMELNTHIFNLTEWKKQKEKNKAFYQDVISDGINLIGELPLID